MSGAFLWHWLAPVAAAPFVGSFLGVIAERLPAGRPVLIARSACPACDHRLGARDLVPVLSWLFNRGRCRHCGAALGLFYPGIELAALVLALWAAAVVSGWLLWASCALGWLLLALAVIDARRLVLPDALVLPLIPVGLALAYAVEPARVAEHALGAVLGFAAFVGLGWAWRRLRGRDALGLGDAKLLAAAGAWVSWTGLGGVVLIAAASGLAFALARAVCGHPFAADARLPFGPHLALGLWITWLHGPIMIG